MLPGIQNPTVTMIGILAQTDIRHDHHFWNFFFDGANGLLHDPILCKVFKPDRILLLWDAKQDDSLHTGPQGGFRLTDRFFHRQLIYAWHRTDLAATLPMP